MRGEKGKIENPMETPNCLKDLDSNEVNLSNTPNFPLFFVMAMRSKMGTTEKNTMRKRKKKRMGYRTTTTIITTWVAWRF